MVFIILNSIINVKMTGLNVRFFHSFAKLNIIIQKATLFAE